MATNTNPQEARQEKRAVQGLREEMPRGHVRFHKATWLEMRSPGWKEPDLGRFCRFPMTQELLSNEQMRGWTLLGSRRHTWETLTTETPVKGVQKPRDHGPPWMAEPGGFADAPDRRRDSQGVRRWPDPGQGGAAEGVDIAGVICRESQVGHVRCLSDI